MTSVFSKFNCNACRVLGPASLTLLPMFTNNKGFSPAGQFGMLLVFGGAGLVAGGVAAAAVLLLNGTPIADMEKAMNDPANSSMLKLVQFISTLLSFFLPAVAFAFVCFRKGWQVLGFRKPVVLQTALVAILIIFAAGPLIDALTQVNKAIPISASLKSFFDRMEAQYEEQVKVLGAVNSLPQYLLSLIIIALLPAVFEETLFRGALQGILQRWFKNAWVAIIVTGLLFSIIHFSWYGFLPRWALGILLGMVYYATGNIWYSIIVHFVNNALVVTYMYYKTMRGEPIPSSTDAMFPLWVGVLALVAVVLLFRLLVKTAPVLPEVETDYQRHHPFSSQNTTEDAG